MMIPHCMRLDFLDPYPLILRRPQPKSQADIWMEQEFAELMLKKIRAKIKDLKDQNTPQSKSMAEALERDSQRHMETVVKEHAPGEWRKDKPKIVGDYICSRVNCTDWVRHWNGSLWSAAWHRSRKLAYDLSKASKRPPPLREVKYLVRAPIQSLNWLPGLV